MSWRSTGTLLSGPPSASLPSSSSVPVGQRLRPNHSAGGGVFARESAYTRHYGVDKDALSALERSRRTEWDVLKEHHRFAREGEGEGLDEGNQLTWEEKLARSYESKLFREFALIDLKHYKSHQFALRWRTAPEVVNGLGESTCASLRCRFHHPQSHDPDSAAVDPRDLRFRDDAYSTSTIAPSARHARRRGSRSDEMPELRSFELPFVYAEGGERKETLVKVRLCPKCAGKLRWKPSSTSGSASGSGSKNKGKGKYTDSEDDSDGGLAREGRNPGGQDDSNHRRQRRQQEEVRKDASRRDEDRDRIRVKEKRTDRDGERQDAPRQGRKDGRRDRDRDRDRSGSPRRPRRDERT